MNNNGQDLPFPNEVHIALAGLLTQFADGTRDLLNDVLKIPHGQVRYGRDEVSPDQVAFAVFQIACDNMGDPNVRPGDKVVRDLMDDFRRYIGEDEEE